jgi:hypothetical protein
VTLHPRLSVSHKQSAFPITRRHYRKVARDVGIDGDLRAIRRGFLMGLLCAALCGATAYGPVIALWVHGL